MSRNGVNLDDDHQEFLADMHEVCDCGIDKDSNVMRWTGGISIERVKREDGTWKYKTTDDY